MSAIVFEQPLNERTRTLLRLEFLFNQLNFHRQEATDWSYRVALQTLLDIAELMMRGDMKSEVVKELEAASASLSRYADNPSVDQSVLRQISEQVLQLNQRMLSSPAQLGSHTKVVELLNTVKQRSTIPGGTCEFDVPSLQYWLLSSPEKKAEELESWLAPFADIQQAIGLALQMLRDSQPPTQEVAENGSLHKHLNNERPTPLIRVALSAEDNVFPEISGGRHGLSIRFLEQGSADLRANQVDRNIRFKLTCCVY